jgi:hypothetical protein
MNPLLLLLAAIYGLFLLWHYRWRSRPLTVAEVDKVLAGYGDAGITPEQSARFRAFFAADDGKPYFMLNLMQVRRQAVYPDGLHPEVKTGRHAHRLYGRMVLKQLLRRGSYPVFIAKKIAGIVDAGPGTDFFDEVAIVRYRSRRDMLDMIVDPTYIANLPHKWASLERTVIVSTKKLLLLDLGVLFPILLILVGLVARTLAG